MVNLLHYVKDRWLRHHNYTPQAKDERDYKYEDHFRISGSGYIESIDLRKEYDTIRDQERTQACVGFAISHYLETIFKKYNPRYNISPLYNWYYAKKKHGWEKENKGVWIRYGVNSIRQQGMVNFNLMPYHATTYLNPPSSLAEQNAIEWKNLITTNRLAYYNIQFSNIISSLKDGYPVLFGSWLNNSFYGNTTGIIKNTTPNSYAHAMLIMGYDQPTNCFLVANSWGRRWGNNGYCFVPMKYLYDNGFDYTVIREEPIKKRK